MTPSYDCGCSNQDKTRSLFFVILSTIMHIFFNLPVAVRSMYSLKPNVNIRIGGIVFDVHDESSERI